MWATFIGSTLVQSPVPGERKSGMPEGTLMPAPVRATAQLDSLISSARASASAPFTPVSLPTRRMMPAPPAWGRAGLELGPGDAQRVGAAGAAGADLDPHLGGAA